MPTTPSGWGTTLEAPGWNHRLVGRRSGFIQPRRWRRAWRMPSSDGKISRSCVSWRDRLPKSREMASAHSPAWSFTSDSSRPRQVDPRVGAGIGLAGEGFAMTGKLGVEGGRQGESVSRNDVKKSYVSMLN